MSNPTCPNCGYDVTGLAKVRTRCSCPECGKLSTYSQTTSGPRTPRTIRMAIITLLIIPSTISIVSWIWLYIGTGLQGAGPILLAFLVLNIHLPASALGLTIREVKSRNRFAAHLFRTSLGAVLFVILLCLIVSELLLWLCIADWIEAIANV